MQLRHDRSREKRGGLGVRLATPPCQTINATETDTREQDVNGARNEEPQTLGMMTKDRQTQPAAGILKPDFLNPESKLWIGCRNARTLYQAVKLMD